MKNKIVHYAGIKEIDLNVLRGKLDMGITRFLLFISGQIIPTTKEITISCIILEEGRGRIFGDV